MIKAATEIDWATLSLSLRPKNFLSFLEIVHPEVSHVSIPARELEPFQPDGYTLHLHFLIRAAFPALRRSASVASATDACIARSIQHSIASSPKSGYTPYYAD